jgi:hypothetical protein
MTPSHDVIDHLPYVEGVLNYLEPMAERPMNLAYDPPPGVPRFGTRRRCGGCRGSSRRGLPHRRRRHSSKSVLERTWGNNWQIPIGPQPTRTAILTAK